MLFKLSKCCLHLLLTLASANTESWNTIQRLQEEYPQKFRVHRELTVASVIPDQYIVVMSKNRTHITTQDSSFSTQQDKNFRRRLFPEEKNNGEVNTLLSTLIDGTLENQREGDFRVMVDNVYTHIFDGFSATLSPLAARFVLDDPNVESVEPNMLASIATRQKNPTWNLDRIDQQTSTLDLQFNTGSLNGEGVPIYILDTGVNERHNDFAGRIQNSVDFVKDGKGSRDCNGHGTHCASTALGTRWGVAKKALLNSVRVLDCNGSGSWSGILSGLDWSVQQIVNQGRLGVISMSLGGQKSSILDRAVGSAVRQGALVIVAAGNEDSNACGTSPANEPLAIAVGASTQRDQRASFSNFGPCVDIYAPGVSIRAASHLSDTGTTLLSGTSMACPHVSGAAALEIQNMNIEGQLTTPNTVRTQILNSATRGVLSNLRGGPNLLLRVPFRSGNVEPTPNLRPSPQPRPPSTCQTLDRTPCIFPFVFRNVQYNTCTTDHDPNGQPWCSTRTEPNTNKHLSGFWGNCDMSTCDPTCVMKTVEGKNCVFPFVFKGIIHNECTSVDDPQSKRWCSTKVDPNTNEHVAKDGNWGHCVMNCPILPTRNPTSIPTPSNPLSPPVPTPQNINIPPIDCKLFDAINDVRALNNLPTLKLDSRLHRAAQKHSEDMATQNYFSHVSPSGSTPAQRVSKEGYQWESVSENIAAGYSTVEDVVNGWVNSPGHFQNILCSSCTHTGISKVTAIDSQWGTYYTQVFASGDSPRTNEDDVCESPTFPRPTPSFRNPTLVPTLEPSRLPTEFPTNMPSKFPTSTPTNPQTTLPTPSPIRVPTLSPNEPRLDDDTLDNVDQTCRTLAVLDDITKTCVFPFVYKSVLYTKCTVVDHNRPWCATATNAFGQFINGQWGVCDLDRCNIGDEICQLQMMNGAWSNKETQLLAFSFDQTHHMTAQQTQVNRQEDIVILPVNQTKSSAKKMSVLLICTISSAILNIMFCVYTVYKKKNNELHQLSEPVISVIQTPSKDNTPHASVSTLTTSASL